jgi:hypothetical protein
VEAVSKCLAFSGYKAREDERAQGGKEKATNEKKKEKNWDRTEDRKKKTKEKETKKKQRETRGSSHSTGRTSCFYYHLLCPEQGQKPRGLVKR